MISNKHKTPLKARTLSPRQHFLSPNNDDFEKAQARAARVAAQRRKSFVGLDAQNAGQGRRSSVGEEDVLSKDQILELFQNCIRLATENKINQRNTWELRLIDHLSQIVKAEDGDDAETNFQKASCTLEAGVKIYSYRVDSVHSETFKVLGGLNRTSADDGDDIDNDSGDGGEEEHGNKKKDTQKKASTSSATLESYDALNVKKFDVAFTVDPLFHQTSAQFDEGGAKGLLLNTLSVFSGCTIVFDSNDIPMKSIKSGATQNIGESVTIDPSCMKDCFEQLKANVQVETEISPTLREIVNMLDDPYRAAAEAEGARQAADFNSGFCVDDQSSVCEEEDAGEVFDEGGSDHFEENHEPGNGESYVGMSQDPITWDSGGPGQEYKEDNLGSGEASSVEDDSMMGGKHIVSWITSGQDWPSKSNAWAGPDHWKYKRAQDNPRTLEPSIPISEKKKKKPKIEKFSLDFLHPAKVDLAAFVPLPDTRSLSMPQSNSSVSTLLPEDCHYQAEDLVRLYLQPSVMCINHKGRRKTEITRQRSSAFESSLFGMQWDHSGNEGVDDGWDDENMQSDVEDPQDGEMVPQPRKVQKITVTYDRMSKQVDVRVLKETLWERMQEMPSSEQDFAEHGVSFRSLMNHLPTDSAAAAPSDISVHLCFICLLHLANEHNLLIEDCTSLNELRIHNISSDYCTSDITTD